MYFDFTSPYAYCAIFALDRMTQEYKLRITLKPILIGYIFKKDQRAVPMLDPRRHDYMLMDFARSAAFYDLPFAMPAVFPFSSLTLHRLLACLDDEPESLNRKAAFIRDGCRQIFAEGASLSNLEACQNLITKHEIPIKKLSQPDVKSRPFTLSQEAYEAGVFGVPFLTFRKQIYWGVDRLPHLEKFLKTSAHQA